MASTLGLAYSSSYYYIVYYSCINFIHTLFKTLLG